MLEIVLPHVLSGTRHSFRPKLSCWQASLGVSVFLVLFLNRSFWSEVFSVLPPSQGHLFFISTLFLFLILLLQVFLLIISVDYVFKPAVIFILLTSSCAAYFMDTYGVIIDRGMVQNSLETDIREVRDLLSLTLVYYVLFLGAVPAWFVWRLKLEYQPLRREGLKRLLLIFTNLVIMTGLLFASFGNFIDLGKSHKYVRHMINPVNFIYAVSSYTSRSMRGPKTMQSIGLDAKLVTPTGDLQKPRLFIFVLGETARASNFSLNGYRQNTNPRLAKEDIFNFTDFYSCGTATAYSLPCIFSPLGRRQFSPTRAKRSEGLLDVLSRAGVGVLWRDNQSGCKGVCNRVDNESMRGVNVEGLCENGECMDMVLLEGLQHHIDRSAGKDQFIVLHQMGSHGPAYFQRYPKEFAVFTPECKSSQLQLCKDEEVVNSYDNSILYTDYFLSQVIAFLKENSGRYNTAMMYVSDHGESLGENNIYLHGMPYLIAPDAQKHVPFITWFSDGFLNEAGVAKADIRKRQDEALSQDIIFHTVLGAMGVTTKLYNPALDLLVVDDEGTS